MPFLKTPFQFGKITLPNNIFYAPLAGCSDMPFRQMSAKYRPGLIYCEMVKMEALVRYDQNTLHLLDYTGDMHPIGAQLCGSNPKIAGDAASIIEELGFDVVDLNCGCPVDKVTKDGSGSGLLKTPNVIGDIISNMVAAVDIPVTVKIRVGWDEENIVAPLITQIAEEAGATAIAIHGRTRKQAYRGDANWDYIKACKEVAKTIKVIGNGDVFESDHAFRLFDETACDAVLVARGTMGQPWIAEEIIRKLQEDNVESYSLEACRQELLAHYDKTVNYQNDRRALLGMRRVGCWYLKKASETKEFRSRMSRVEDLAEARELILEMGEHS
ncbi:MAG: tRNA dihydrouridine synthase DusB [Waddliaceae bacterium]